MFVLCLHGISLGSTVSSQVDRLVKLIASWYELAYVFCLEMDCYLTKYCHLSDFDNGMIVGA